MKCIIPGTNCKIMAKAVQALAKIGDEIWVQLRETSLTFRTVGTESFAYSDFTFNNSFFSSYTFDDCAEEDALKCKISMRSAMMVFKSPALIDKLVETCHIRLEPNADTLLFIYKYKNSVTKTFLLPIIDCEALQVVYSKDNVPNKLAIHSQSLTNAVHNFRQSLVEITIEVTAQKLLMRNYVDETSTIANVTRTQLALTPADFHEYKVGLDSCITFSMKDLRAVLTFAESVGLPITISFDSAGRPIVFDIKNPSFEANLVLSTLNPNGDDVSLSSVQSAKQSSRKRAAPKTTSRQSSKSSLFRRPISKSIFSNASSQSKSLLSTKTIETNSPSELTNSPTVEVVESDLNFRGSNGVSSKNPALPEIGQTSTGSSVVQNLARKRAHVIESASTSRASPTSSGLSSPKIADVASDKQTEHSIFSPTWKRKPSNTNADDTEMAIDAAVDEPMDQDIVPNSPPPKTKKTKLIFKKCFQATFDPRMLPGHDSMILAEDSDEDI